MLLLIKVVDSEIFILAGVAIWIGCGITIKLSVITLCSVIMRNRNGPIKHLLQYVISLMSR